MNIDSTIISIGALFVSIISLVIAVYNFGVDRRIQIEQLKGEMVNRLTFRGIEILSHIDKLCRCGTEETCDRSKRLIKVSEGIVQVRKELKGLSRPPLFFVSSRVTELHQIRSEIQDAEPVFDKLNEAISDLDLEKIERITEGLASRLWGSPKSIE
jgi:hypothetical protein